MAESTNISESIVEQSALAWFESIGYSIVSGPVIAPDEPGAERQTYTDVILANRLQKALSDINPSIPEAALEEAFRKIFQTTSANAIENNRRFHRMLTDGVDVSYKIENREVHDKVRLIDVEDLENNNFLAVNQFTVKENERTRRADIVVFINGLPLAIFELKNATDEQATVNNALNSCKHTRTR